MDGETVLTATPLAAEGVLYAEVRAGPPRGRARGEGGACEGHAPSRLQVQANNTVTAGTATAVVEIRVLEQEPAPTGESARPPRAVAPGRPVASAGLAASLGQACRGQR